MCKKQCNFISLKCQHSHVLFNELGLKRTLFRSTWLSQVASETSIYMLYGTQLTQIDSVCPVSPPRMQCLSSGCWQATSCCLTRPPATLHRHGRVLCPPFPMEISLLIHGAAVTAALLWKMMRAQGLPQKEPIFPLHLGSYNPDDRLKIQSVTYCPLNEPLCLNTSWYKRFSHSQACVFCVNSCVRSRGFWQ